MPLPALPLFIEPKDLEPLLDRSDLVIIDFNKIESYQKNHIPGAVRLDYSSVVRIEKPVFGLLPDQETLTQVFSNIGLSPDKHAILYDEEGNGMACRTAWTLEVCGFHQFSILNGGLVSWFNEGHPVESQERTPVPAKFVAKYSDTPIASKAYILEQLSNPNIRILDARTPEEYRGEKKIVDKVGHIPGAVNMNWLESINANHNARLKTKDELRNQLASLGFTPDKEIIAYCQSHQRSAHVYMTLRHLGYPKVRGFPGSWSDWGSDPATPVEC